MQRRAFLLATLGAAACGRRDNSALGRAVRWLWRQQADDGGWHSKTYGLLRSGQSLTPFVLDALLEIPESVYPLPRTKVERALRERPEPRPAGGLGGAGQANAGLSAPTAVHGTERLAPRTSGVRSLG